MCAGFARRADDEPVDPKPEVEESCKPKCVKQLLAYQVRAVGFSRTIGAAQPVFESGWLTPRGGAEREQCVGNRGQREGLSGKGVMVVADLGLGV